MYKQRDSGVEEARKTKKKLGINKLFWENDKKKRTRDEFRTSFYR